jgi:hypothetical protein
MARASTYVRGDGTGAIGLSFFHNIKGVAGNETGAAMGETASTACTAAAVDTGCTITAADTVLKLETVRAVTGCRSPSHWRLLI